MPIMKKSINANWSIFLTLALWLGCLMPPLFSDELLNGAMELGSGIGVCVHFIRPLPGEMDLIQAANIKILRTDLFWSQTELEKNVYDFSAYDNFLSTCEAHGIRVVFILDYVNKYYDEGKSPYSNNGRVAFCNWALAAISHFSNRNIFWEIYNEPNTVFWRPSPITEDYISLLEMLTNKVHKSFPFETMIGPATSGTPIKFLTQCSQNSSFKLLSAISVHPYRQTEPETIIDQFNGLKLIFKLNNVQAPIISSEWGYSANWKKFDEDKQSNYLVRCILSNAIAGAPITIWYDWMDDGMGENYENHFGLVRHLTLKDIAENKKFDLKPSYLSLKCLTTILGHFHFIDMKLMSDYIFVSHFVEGQKNAFVVWSSSQSSQNKVITIPPGKYELIDQSGNKQNDPISSDGHCTLTIGNKIIYLVESFSVGK